jgi:hypothetical protein
MLRPLFAAPALLLIATAQPGSAAENKNSPAASVSSPSAPASPITLTATLATPVDIDLSWKNAAPAEAQVYAIEWTTDPELGFSVLEYVGPDQRTFRHPSLMPDTPQYYRIRPLHGQAPAPARVTLPADLLDKDYLARMESPEDFSWAAPAKSPAASPTLQLSMRDPQTASRAAPSQLKAALVPITVSGFKVTWTDQARDEEGYLLEIKPEGKDAFEVVARLEPDVTSIGYALSPPHRSAQIRVRAYYLGNPSNTVRLITGLPSEPR